MSDKPTNVLLLIWTFITSPISIAIISFIAGAIISLFAPWNKWFIERKKSNNLIVKKILSNGAKWFMKSQAHKMVQINQFPIY